MAVEVFTNIDGFMAQGAGNEVVCHRVAPPYFHIPSSVIRKLECWPVLCAEISDPTIRGWAMVHVSAPVWPRANDPVDFRLDVFCLGDMNRESMPPKEFWGANIVPGLGDMEVWVGLDTVAVWQATPLHGKINRKPEPPLLCVMGKKTSDGELSLDLSFVPGNTPIAAGSDILRVKPFLRAEWAFEGSPRAYLYSARISSQKAGVIAFAFKEKKRRIILCYADDIAWLKPVIESMPAGG